MELTINIENVGRATVLKLHGDMTVSSEDVLHKTASQFLEKGDAKIIMDLAEVPFITSSGLGELVRLTAQANSQGGRIILVGLTPFVADVLATTKLDKFFEIATTPAEAMGRF